MSDLARKATLILGCIILFVALISMVSYKKDLHARTALEELFQTDAGQFKKYFGIDPQQPTAELHALVQERVARKTTQLWCVHEYSQQHGWKESSRMALYEADRAMRLAEQFGYEPVTPSSRSFLEDPLEGCPAQYQRRPKHESNDDRCVTEDFRWKTWDKTCPSNPAQKEKK